VLSPPTKQPLTLYWQAAETITQDYEVSLRLVDETGTEARRWSGPPTRGLAPTSTWQAGDILRDPWLLDLGGDAAKPLAPGRYQLTVALTSEAGPSLSLGEVEVIDRRRLFTLPDTAKPVVARFAEAITLVGYELSEAPLTGGARFILTLYWQTNQPIAQDYTVFSQILGPDGTVVGQHDGPPAEGLLPTTIWEAEEIIPDRHQIEVPLRQSGEYRLIVGLYDSTSGERLSLVGGSEQPGSDFVQLHTFNLKASR
jgi:hypothetical protein